MKILLIGATGYVGGEVLYTLASLKSDAFQIVCLIRDQAKAQQVQAGYPKVQTVHGDLDDEALVTREAEASDIVLHLAASSHIPSAKAIAKGLQDRSQRVKSPGYWIQISGATCFAGEEIASGKFGYATDQIYDDVKDQSKINSVLRNHSKRVVENTVLSQDAATIKTALIIGPLIYGPGRGPVNQRSIQAPEIAKSTLRLGHGIKLNGGKNIWSNVHVQDLASIISSLVFAASKGQDGLWNDAGIYNAENGEMTFERLDSIIAEEAKSQGLINDNTLQTINAAKADSLSGHASILWGTNARTVASRARQKLDWVPSGQSLADTIPESIESEARDLKEIVG